LNLVLPTSNLGHNLPSPGLEDLFPTDWHPPSTPYPTDRWGF
jgi:hypothetical protein